MGSRVDEALLTRVATGTASPDERARALEIMRDDPAAAKTYRTLVESERALSGGPLDVPTAAELDALLPGVLDRVAPARAPSRRLALVGLPALAAAAAMAFVVVRSSDDGFRERGGAATAVPFEIFCVDKSGPRALTATAATCPIGATLVVGLPTSFAGGSLQLELADANERVHAAAGGTDPARPDTAVVPAGGLSTLFLDVTSEIAAGRGKVVARFTRDGETRSGERSVDIIAAAP